jgi:hypothetical protein
MFGGEFLSLFACTTVAFLAKAPRKSANCKVNNDNDDLRCHARMLAIKLTPKKWI